jgi:hypothetical protein
MVVRIARGAAASGALIAALAAAQSPTGLPAQSGTAMPSQAGAALPPQNYGSQPGFFRSAPEMAALAGAIQGVVAPAPAQPAPQPSTASPVAAPVVAPQASTVVVAPERIPDPTQNLQWAERQMDRAESTAAQQRAQAQAVPPPVAPGAYNGSTNPADR